VTKNGFTLIELLLALAISAIIAMYTLSLFNTVMNSKSALIEQAAETSQLTRSMRKLEQDFIQLSPYRSVRNPYGEYIPPMHLDFEGLYLTRTGWANSVFMSYERSTQQRVHYRLAEPGSELCPLLEQDELNDLGGCLIRSYMAHLDDDGSLAWQHQNILRPLKTIEFEFLVFNPVQNNTEYRSEPPTEDPRTGITIERILGVMVTFEMGTGRTYQRLFRTPSQPLFELEEEGV
jgi:general secretion pathway protein J